MIVFWIDRTPVARSKLRIPKGTTILKAFSTLNGHAGYQELLEWGKKMDLTEMDMHAGRSRRMHFDLWGEKLIKGIKWLLKETHRSYSWKASREKARVTQ